MSDNDLPDVGRVPQKLDPDLRRLLESFRAHIRRLRGFDGAGQAAVTQDAIEGISSGVAGPPGPPGPAGADGDVYIPDLSAPPTPTGVTLSAGFTFVNIETDEPIFTQGHGYAVTVVYGAVWDAGDPTPPTFSEAVKVREFIGDVGSFPTDPATRWCIWLKWKTQDGVESAFPSGGSNGDQITTGLDVSAVLEALTGAVRQSELAAALSTRIDLIDGPDSLAGSVAARVKAEQDARIAALATTNGNVAAATARVTDLEATVNNPTTGVAATASALDTVEAIVTHGTSGNSALASRTAVVEASTTALQNAGGNRVSNSSFELDTDGNGVADGFVVYNNGSIAVTTGPSGGYVRGYAQRVDFTGTPNTSTQGIVVETANPAWVPNKTYIAAFVARGFGGQVGRPIQIGWNVAPAVQTAILNPALSNNWQRYAFKLVMGASVEANGRLHITSQTGSPARNGALDFDDITIYEGTELLPYEPGRDSGGAMSAAVLTEQTARVAGDTANANSITTISARLTNGDLAQFAARQTWDFNNPASTDGWSGYAASAYGSVTPSQGALVGASNAAGDFILEYNLATVERFLGATADKIRARIKKPATSAQWSGFLYYSTTTRAGQVFGKHKVITEPAWDANGWAVCEWDMATSADPDEWAAGTITGVRIDLWRDTDGPSFTGVLVDWVAIGARTSAASSAVVQQEIDARVTGDTANATAITTVQSRVDAARAAGASVWPDPHILDAAAWQVAAWGALPSIVTLSDGVSGTKAFRSPSGSQASARGVKRVPLTEGRKYRISAKARKTADANGYLYIRLDRGTAETGSYAESVIGVEAIIPTTSWATYSGEFTATSTQKFGSPIVLLNYSSTLGYMEAQDIRIEDVTEATTLAASIQTEATTRADQAGHLGALYTVRVQLTEGGRTVMGGFGVSGTSGGTAGATIDFGVQANKFWIGAPTGSTGVSDVQPFVVQTTDATVNGVTIPKGVYMDAAYIKNLSVMWARFGTLVADSIQATAISAAQLTLGDGTVGGNLKSTVYTGGSAGWIIRPDGYAEFSNAVIRGAVYASTGAIGGSYIGSTYIQSTTWVSGSNGWRLNSDGTGWVGGLWFYGPGLRSAGYVANSTGIEIDGAAGTIKAFADGGNRVLNTAATGTQSFIRVGTALDVKANGDASFGGALNAATGTFAGALSAATGTFSGSLTAAAVNAVNTINLAGNSVTIPAQAEWSGSTNSTSQLVSTASYSFEGQPVVIIAQLIISNPDSVPSGGARIYKNGSVFFTGPIESPGVLVTGLGLQRKSLTLVCMDPTSSASPSNYGAGGHNLTGGATIVSANITVIGAKR